MSWITIIFYILLLDAVTAVAMSFAGKQNWWQTHLGSWAQHFPLARGWCVYYLFLVLIIGWLLERSGELMLPF